MIAVLRYVEPLSVCRIARGARLRRQVQPRPTGLVSAVLLLSAPSAALRCVCFFTAEARSAQRGFFLCALGGSAVRLFFSPSGRRVRRKDFYSVPPASLRCVSLFTADCVLSVSAVRFRYRQHTSNHARKCVRTLTVSCQFCYGTITTAPPEGSSALHLPFQASGRPNSPFSPCGRRGQGDEGQRKEIGGMRSKSARSLCDNA